MNQKVLSECINILTSTFGEAVAKGQRLNAISLYLSGLKENDAVELCNSICLTFRNYPLPNEVQKAVNDFKKNYFYRTGKSYHNTDDVIEVQYTKIECEDCYETGILRVEFLTNGTQQLMRCHCKFGKENNAALPWWDLKDHTLKQIFKKIPINYKWFNPQLDESQNEENQFNKIMVKVSEWKRAIRNSEKYWQELKGG